VVDQGDGEGVVHKHLDHLGGGCRVCVVVGGGFQSVRRCAKVESSRRRTLEGRLSPPNPTTHLAVLQPNQQGFTLWRSSRHLMLVRGAMGLA